MAPYLQILSFRPVHLHRSLVGSSFAVCPVLRFAAISSFLPFSRAENTLPIFIHPVLHVTKTAVI